MPQGFRILIVARLAGQGRDVHRGAGSCRGLTQCLDRDRPIALVSGCGRGR